MLGYCTGAGCRHAALLEYFGQKLKEKCGACDVCRGEVDLAPEALVTGQKILSCVYRLGESFGADHTAKVLAGSREEALHRNGHHLLSTYGILGEHRHGTLRDWIGQLVGQGFLRQEGEFRQLKITRRGWELLQGRARPNLLRPAAAARPAGSRSQVEKEAWEGVDRELFQVLRRLRLRLAGERGVPPFVVFGDRSLRQMARRRPATAAEMLAIDGVGEKKLEEYGQLFLAAITAWQGSHPGSDHTKSIAGNELG